MEKDCTSSTSNEHSSDEKELVSRREYLIGLKKWSKAVIGGVLLGGLLASTDKEAEAAGVGWVNRRGSWGNGAWANRSSGGGSWVNRRGGWIDGGSWNNRGGSWSNRGASWANYR